jgi:NAD(P)-dependent dehydrogenase (short-subunit alcohol dehydrogenase family)
MDRLAGKAAIVTGAASGIGRATTLRFVEEGARVLASDLDVGKLGEAFESREGVVAVPADVTEPATPELLVQSALDHFGALDILVNNAGIVDRFLPVGEMTDEIWEQVLDVNLNAPFRLARRAVPVMLEHGSGVIVNVGSIAGARGGRGGAAYTTSKHGLRGLTENLSATYAPLGLRSVLVAPGGVETGISLGGEPSALGMETLEKSLVCSVRFASAEELANVILFVASDEASFISGAEVVADGGWTVC